MIVITDTEVYSDSGRLVHRIGTNTYFVSCMKFPDDTMTDFEEVDAIPQRTIVPSITEQIRAFIRSMTREMTEIADNDALKIKDLFDDWIDYIADDAENLKVGQIVKTADGLWRVRQEHKAQKHYAPSIHTASLYERIVKDHAGTEDDPIPYAPPMEIFNGKYYTQDDVLYLCTRDSGQALTHNLSELVGLYVEVVMQDTM